jgi:hypothetical protein
MGESHMVVCSDCGQHFRMTSGPGMKFLVLHCDKCGRDKGIGFDAFGASLEQTSEGVGPYNLEQARDMDWPAAIRSQRAALRQRVESIAGPCPCGGAFTLDAPARCPDCSSDQFVVDANDEPILYD